jgi:hypothetical protein
MEITGEENSVVLGADLEGLWIGAGTRSNWADVQLKAIDQNVWS